MTIGININKLIYEVIINESIQVQSLMDEYGEIDYELANELYKITKDVDLGITSDREPALVAITDDGLIVGGVYTSFDGDNYTFDVVVSKNYQSTGIGSKLLDYAIGLRSDYLDIEPNSTMQIDVVSSKMKQMLEKRGFVVIDVIGNDRWLMEPKDEVSDIYNESLEPNKPTKYSSFKRMVNKGTNNTFEVSGKKFTTSKGNKVEVIFIPEYDNSYEVVFTVNNTYEDDERTDTGRDVEIFSGVIYLIRKMLSDNKNIKEITINPRSSKNDSKVYRNLDEEKAKKDLINAIYKFEHNIKYVDYPKEPSDRIKNTYLKFNRDISSFLGQGNPVHL